MRHPAVAHHARGAPQRTARLHRVTPSLTTLTASLCSLCVVGGSVVIRSPQTFHHKHKSRRRGCTKKRQGNYSPRRGSLPTTFMAVPGPQLGRRGDHLKFLCRRSYQHTVHVRLEG